MIYIRRQGDHPTPYWSFDGWFLLPERELRDPLVFDGNDFLDFHSDPTKRWQLTGPNITMFHDQDPLWRFVDGRLENPSAPGEIRWRFDGATLEQDTEVRPDRWLATGDVPLLVIAYAAGLI